MAGVSKSLNSTLIFDIPAYLRCSALRPPLPFKDCKQVRSRYKLEKKTREGKLAETMNDTRDIHPFPVLLKYHKDGVHIIEPFLEISYQNPNQSFKTLFEVT
jgi:hypothetical protein